MNTYIDNIKDLVNEHLDFLSETFMSKRDIALYVDDIKSSIGKIEEYTIDISNEKFSNDTKTIDVADPENQIVNA